MGFDKYGLYEWDSTNTAFLSGIRQIRSTISVLVSLTNISEISYHRELMGCEFSNLKQINKIELMIILQTKVLLSQELSL